MKFTGIVWKTGNANVITLPKKQTKVKPGDKVLINIEKLDEGDYGNKGN